MKKHGCPTVRYRSIIDIYIIFYFAFHAKALRLGYCYTKLYREIEIKYDDNVK